MIGEDTMPDDFKAIAERVFARGKGGDATPREFIDLCLIFAKYVEAATDWDILNNMVIALTSVGARASRNDDRRIYYLANEFPTMEDDVHAFNLTYEDQRKYWSRLKPLILELDNAYSPSKKDDHE